MAHTALSADFSITSTLAVSSHLERSRNRQSEGVETTMLQRSMTNEPPTNARLSDAELLDEIKRLTANERQATARLIAALGELDARRLYLERGLLIALHLLHSGSSSV